MAPRARIHLRGALYHVISRGNQRQKIYKDEEDHCRFEALLGEVAKRRSIMLYAYILMPNHFHLLLEVGHTHLSKAMQSLLYRYTRHYNRRYRKIGHLFQGRYRAILCDRDSYLMELIRYLHLNPARAALASEPGDYRWSSHRDYLRGKSAIGFAMERRLELWGATRRQARKVGGISLTAAAKVLRRDLSTMSLALKTLEDELRNDSHQRQRLEGFCAQLRKGRRRKYQTSKA